MKKTMKYMIFALTAQLLCSTAFVTPAAAGATESSIEFSGVIAMFVQKLEKIFSYKEEIQKTLDLKEGFGEMGLNAATDMLGQGAGFMSSFQDSLHFDDLGSISSVVGDVQGSVGDLTGAVDSVKGTVSDVQGKISDVQGTISGVQGQVEGVVSDAKGKLDGAISGVQGQVEGVVSDAKGKVEGAVSDAQNSISSVGGSGGTGTGSEKTASTGSGGSAASSNPKSSASKVLTITSSYGKPQASKEEAQEYVKNAFFYSTREGDVSSGEALQEMDAAEKLVQQNRKGYYREVIASALGQANEAINTNYEESQSRMEDVMKKAQSAETYDDKKAVESVITQNDTRERMARLSLELATLEQDAVSLLMYEPTDYLIPRSADEIRAETTAAMQEMDYKNVKEES